MLLRVLVLLAIAVGLAWHFQLIPAAWLNQISSVGDSARPAPEPAAMYKWTDANGRVVYGNQPPPGRKAERLSGERGSVSVVEATKVPPPAASQPAAGEPSVRDKMMDRVIENQGR